MKKVARSIMLSSLLFGCITAQASSQNVNGSNITIRTNAESDGTLRVGILIAGAPITACAATSGWYSTNIGTNQSVRKAWLNDLLAAKAAGLSVTIAGTGTCDANSVESISYIDVN